MALLRNKKWIFVVIGVILCGVGSYVYFQGKAKKPSGSPQEKVMEVKKGNIRFTVSGTSQFEARDMQNIIAPADGTIKTMNLTRNQAVKKGDVLVEIADPELEASLQDAQITLQQLQNDLDDLRRQQGSLMVTAPISGKMTLTSNMDTGSNVNKSSRIATIADVSSMTVKLPFLLEDAMQLHKGDSIDLTVDGFLLTKTGVVEKVNKQPHADTSGNKLMDVEVRVVNDGTLDTGMKVKGSTVIGGRNVESQDKNTVDYINVETVFANANGSIRDLKWKSGNFVRKGDLIAVIGSDTLNNDIISKQAAIERQKVTVAGLEDKLKQLTLTAPFDGVFSTDFANKKSNVLASYPVGSKVEATTQFGAVASLDYMQLPIQVDEIDLPNVKTGMKAEVKVDSLPGKLFEGEVNQVSTVGTTTNGVTFFDVVLSVKNTGELRYGMTGTADILIQDKKDIVLLPMEALQQQKGKRFVTLLKPDGSREEQHEIKIGIRSKTDLEVVEGLKPGDQVVVTVRQKQQNLSQSEIDRMRQQFQGGAGGGPTGAGAVGGGGAAGGGMTGGGGAAGGGNSGGSGAGSSRAGGSSGGGNSTR